MNILKLLIVGLLLSVQYCSARIVFGIRDDASNTLVKFDSSNPSQILASTVITGLNSGEIVLGLDIRPSNGKVYIVTSSSVVRIVNTITGVAGAGQTTNACTTPGTSGVKYSVDFNPQVDLLRIISSGGANYAVNVETGACTQNTAISGATIAQVAYTGGRGASSTTLYAINIGVTPSALGTVSPPASGVYGQTAALTVTTTNQVGFDIVGNINWVTLTPTGASSSSLYVIDLTSGATTLVGAIGGSPLRSIAISFTDYDRTFYGHNDAGQLFRFESEDPSSWVPSTITGLTSEFFLGLDFRPLNGILYGVTNSSRVYTINPFTSAATQVGGTLNCSFTGNYFGVDWNPTVDLLRVITDSGANYRINVVTSACFVDSIIRTTASQLVPLISSVAYTNNFQSSTTTTLYAIDYQNDTLGTVIPPNDGVYNFVGNLGSATGPATGFDIFGASNSAVAAIEVGGLPYFVAVDLSNGGVSFLGSPGSTRVRSLSASFTRYPYPQNGFFPTVVVLSADQTLVAFNSNNTQTALASVAVTGLTAGTTLLGMDLRPATNEIIAVSSDSKVYVVYAPTGVAYLKSTITGCSFTSSFVYSFDFNPTVDRLRVVSRSGQNFRIDVDTGACIVDGNIVLASNGASVDSVGVAYTNSFSGATTTAEYVIVAGSPANFAQVTAPNNGTTSIIGSTGVNTNSGSPLDILTNGGQQQAYALIGGILYDVNIGSGALRPYGPITFSNHVGMTVLPQGYVPPPAPGTTTTTTTSTSTTSTSNSTTSTSSSTSTSSTSTTTNSGSSVTVSILLLVACLVMFM